MTERTEAERAAKFMIEMARYFDMCPTFGEDSSHWSNVANAENCRKIAALLSARPEPVAASGDVVRGQLPIWAEDGIAGRISAAMHAYLKDYVYSPDEGCDHEPSDFERWIMEDMLNGALSDQRVNDILQDAAFAMLRPAALASPAASAATGEAVVWRWRSRMKGGAWDAWERGRYGGEVPPFMEVQEQYAAPPAVAPAWPKDPETGMNDLSLGTLLRKTREEAAVAPAPAVAGEMVTSEMIRAAFLALPPDAHGTIGGGEMERILKAALATPSKPTAETVRGWQPMATAPKDGRHCILSVKTGAFYYTAQGAFQNGQWNAVHQDDAKPVAWMPNVLLPDEILAALDHPASADAPPAEAAALGEGE